MLTKVVNIRSRLPITAITRVGPGNRKRARKRQEITTNNTQQKIRKQENSSSSHLLKIRTSRDIGTSVEIDNNADDVSYRLSTVGIFGIDQTSRLRHRTHPQYHYGYGKAL